MKQVLQICHDYEGPFVGICQQYINGFSGHEVTTVFLKGAHDTKVVTALQGSQVYFLERQGENLRGIKFAIIFRLAKLLRQHRFDVVVAHRYKSIYLAGIMSYFFSLPVLLGIAHEHEVFRRITRSLFVTFWRKQFFVAGVSNSVTENIARYCPSLIGQNRLFTLPNAIPDRFESSLMTRSAAREALGLRQEADACLFGTIGRLVSKKNQQLLLKGFAKFLASTDQPATLVIIGEGPERQSLASLAAGLGITSRVVFAGYVANAGRLVSAFDLFILSSGEEEAFGVVLLEAMSGRVPVLSSDVAGPRQVLGESGMLFERDNEMSLAEQLTRFTHMDPNARQAVAEASYRRVRDQFSEQKFAERLAQIPGLVG